MALNTFTVNYPRGFVDKLNQTGSGVSNNGFTKDQCAKWGYDAPKQNLISESYITLSLETLLSTFNNIVNTYKTNLDTYLELDKISEILTNEDSVVKHVIIKLNGTHGRNVKIKNDNIMYPTISYNPVLKETKQHLLILFNKFLNNSKKENDDIIMYEGRILFTHLFAIIIDSFHIPNPLVQIKKDCTDTFAMITLLELVLKKKYKNIINLHLNNIPLPDVDLVVDLEIKTKTTDADCEWDKEDFNSDNCDIDKCDIDKSEDIINESKIEDDIKIIERDKPDEIPDEIPDDWDSL